MISPITIAGLVLVAILSIATASLWKVAGHERAARATAEAQMASWKQASEDCSAATEKAAKDASERSKLAAGELAKARIGADTMKGEIERLRASRASGGACPAGDAVSAARKGLK